MLPGLVLLIICGGAASGKSILNPNIKPVNYGYVANDHHVERQYLPPPVLIPVESDYVNVNKHQGPGFQLPYHLVQTNGVNSILSENALLMALLLGTSLRVPATRNDDASSYGDHHLPVNPYLTLLLSQYGRYLPIQALGTKGLYYYAASNNYHNNKPFGSYKIYENMK